MKMGFNMRLFVLAGLMLALGAGAAQARLEPAPKPSGIVVHLFGPNSVMQSVAPALAGAPDGGQPASRQLGAARPAAMQPAAMQPAAVQAEPSWGNVLHQMFVTGDPNSPTRPARGKIGHQLED